MIYYYKVIKILNIIIFLIALQSNSNLFSLKLPELRFGINSKINLKDYNLDYLEQDYSTDNIYLSLKEELTKFFNFIIKTEYFSYNYNKNVYDINDLKKYKLNYLIQLNFNILKYITITLYTKPYIEFNNIEQEINITYKIQFMLNITKFRLTTYYACFMPFKEDNKILQQFYIAFYWIFPKLDFLKFKFSFYYYFQHINNENTFINPIKKANINFEVIIDFNKLNFEELFDKKEDEIFLE